MTKRVHLSESILKEKLTPLAFQVTQNRGTERPFTGEYYHNEEQGVYLCVCCNEPLFHSETKYDSGSGWPSYYKPISDRAVDSHEDVSLGMKRTEVICANCGAHLGHVFPDGPRPTGLRYCINSVSLQFKKETS